MSGILNQLKKATASGSQRNNAPGVSDFSPEMRFSIEPLPGESGFSQWHSAMKMVSQLPEGIPPEFRRRLWLSLAERHLSARSIDWSKVERNCFSEWSHPADAELGVQIVKDLHRTGCSLFCGKDGQENQALLKRVLLAYARWNKAVGYCQGFNMLAALILQVTEKCEADALKLMIYLIEGVLPDSYFADSLRGLSVDMAVFRELLRTKLPKLSRHLDTLQVASKEGTTSYEPPLTNVFTMQWFLTLFCNCLPQPTVLRVWDLILLEGNEILLRTSLAIWQVLADRIMTVRSADEFYCLMGVLMREILEYDLIDANTLIKGIVQIGPLAELKNLREHYLYNITPWVPPSGQSERRLKVYPKERLMLDIGVLKKQYTKLKQRQRQAHIIFNTAVARQTARPPPVAMNHLLLGKSALVPARRLGPPKGAVPPARQPVPIPKTIHWKDARRDSSSSTSSTSSSDTELCDDPKKARSSSSSSTTEGEDLEDDLPDDNLPSDKTLMTREDNTAEPPQAGDNQIKSDIFDTETSDLYNCLERSDSVVSEDGFDFEKFLEERAKNFKEKAYDSEDSVEDTSEVERIKYARKNSQRALEIIQENSLILHRILQTCQTRLSPTPPPSEQEGLKEAPEERTPTNEDAGTADFPPCDEGTSEVDMVTEADYNLKKYRVKLGSPLIDDAKVEDLVEYSTILKFIRGEELVEGASEMVGVSKSEDVEVESTAEAMVGVNEQINREFKVDSEMVGEDKSEDLRVEPRATKIEVDSEMVGVDKSDGLKQIGSAFKKDGVWIDSEMDKPKIETKGVEVGGVLLDSEMAGVHKSDEVEQIDIEFKVEGVWMDSEMAGVHKSDEVDQIDTEFKVEGAWMDSQMIGVNKSEELLTESTAVKVEEISVGSKIIVVESKEAEVINAAYKVCVNTETVGVHKSKSTSIRASNSAEEVMEETRVEARYVPYSSAKDVQKAGVVFGADVAADFYHRSNLECSIPKVDSPVVERVSSPNNAESVLQASSDKNVDSGVELKKKQELMRFSLSFAEEPKEERCVTTTQKPPFDESLHTTKINPKTEELITIAKDSKYNSILEYSRNLDEKFNSLIMQSRSSKTPLKFTYSLDDTRVSPSWTTLSKSEPPSQKSPLSPIELLSPTLSDDFVPEAKSKNFYLLPEDPESPNKLSPSQTYQKSPVSPILESPGKTYYTSPSYQKSPVSPILESPGKSSPTSPSYLKSSFGKWDHQEIALSSDRESLTMDSASCLNVATEEKTPNSLTSPICLDILRSLPSRYVTSSTFEVLNNRSQTLNLQNDEETYQSNALETWNSFGSPKKTVNFTAAEKLSPSYLGSEDMATSRSSNRTPSPETTSYRKLPISSGSTSLDNPEDRSYRSIYLPSPNSEDLIISRSPNEALALEIDESKPLALANPENLYCMGSPKKTLGIVRSTNETLTPETDKTSPENLYGLESPKKTTPAEEPQLASYLTYSSLEDMGPTRSTKKTAYPDEKTYKCPTSSVRPWSPNESFEDLATLRLPNKTRTADPDEKAYKCLTPTSSVSPRSPRKSFASPRSPNQSPTADPDEKAAAITSLCHPWSPKKVSSPSIAESYLKSCDSPKSESESLSLKYPLSSVSPRSDSLETTPKYPLSPVSPRSEDLETTRSPKYPTSPRVHNLESPTTEEKTRLSPSYPKSPTSDSPKSPNKIFNPFPVAIHSRQNKEVAVRLGLYKK